MLETHSVDFRLSCCQHLLLPMKRKPLVRFETGNRAQLVSSDSMSPRKRSRGHRHKRKSTKGKPRVVHGRLSLKVSGYSGYQRLPASSLIPYLPVTKLRAAAKKVLGKSKVKKTKSRRRKRTTKR
jgi:hypothetical protein